MRGISGRTEGLCGGSLGPSHSQSQRSERHRSLLPSLLWSGRQSLQWAPASRIPPGLLYFPFQT